MYIPIDMKARKRTAIKTPKEGAFQMFSGKIGSVAYFASQMKKRAMWRRETIKREYSYGWCHPTKGA